MYAKIKQVGQDGLKWMKQEKIIHNWKRNTFIKFPSINLQSGDPSILSHMASPKVCGMGYKLTSKEDTSTQGWKDWTRPMNLTRHDHTT